MLCLFAYNANLRTIGGGDDLPARYLPLILWHDSTFAFDANARLVAHGHPLLEPNASVVAAYGNASSDFQPPAYWIVRTHRGQLASMYPVVAPLLVAPLYLPAMLWLDSKGWQQPYIDRVAEIMEKVSASLLAALASLVMFLVLRREGNPWAFPLALVFAFGTDTWMISSQALWQHGAGELLVAIALLLAVARASPLRIGLLGFVCVLIAANRPPDVLIAAAFVLYVVWSRKRTSLWLLAGAALPSAALLYYNLAFIGNVVGGYALAPSATRHGFFQLRLLGLPASLVSPTRGLFIFCPFLIFIAVGLARRLRTPSSRRLAIALSVAVAAQLLVYSQGDWRGGSSWGPRHLTDLLPILVWMLAPAPAALGGRARRLFVVMMVVAVGIQTIGAFWYSHLSDARIFAGTAPMSAAWDPRNTPPLVELEHRPVPGELQCNARGFIDQPPALDGAGGVRELESGMPVRGWALLCGRTPTEVVLLIDGRIIGETTSFFTRPDPNRALNATPASGWTIRADTSGLAPGKHVLQLGVPVTFDTRIVREQPVRLPPPPRTLPAMAALAARRLREDQAPPGYWLTSYTAGARYLIPQPEMNTYLTSILDGPARPGRRQAWTRRCGGPRQAGARGADRGQLGTGPDYHGLPDSPTIGTLGCAITPDADDTALVWRIAGPGASDPRFERMLAILRRYRDGRGLYRTWLAPQDRYECLNPGRDPDPADITIQMHVYLMLREFDRPAARPL